MLSISMADNVISCKKIKRKTKRKKLLILLCKFGSRAQKWPKIAKTMMTQSKFTQFFVNILYILDASWWILMSRRFRIWFRTQWDWYGNLILHCDICQIENCAWYRCWYICVLLEIFVHSRYFILQMLVKSLVKSKCMPRRYWVNKFTGERVYEDPTKNKRSLEQKNQVIYW